MSRPSDETWSIRSGGPDDLAGILKIYNHYVETSHATFDTDPGSVGHREGWIRQFRSDGPYRLMVADSDCGLHGFAYSTRFRTRPAYDSSVETTVYVSPDATGKGVGRALYDVLLKAVDKEGIHRIYAGIALPNPSSICLHESFGFRHVGTFSEAGYKFGKYWDVAWFERCPDDSQTSV